MVEKLNTSDFDAKTKLLDEVLFENYQTAGKETGYWGRYYLRELKNKGGLATLKRMLRPAKDDKASKGFQALLDANRLDLSIEATALDDRFRDLFTEEELAEAVRSLTSVPDYARPDVVKGYKSTPPKRPRNPDWKRDELILALDLYFKINPSRTNNKNPEIIELSNILNSLPIHPNSSHNENFRNPNGVYMKLSNYLRLDPSYEGKGLRCGGKLEETIWNEFSSDKERLRKISSAIKSTLTLNRSSLENSTIEVDEEEESIEGRILTKLHKIRERDPGLVKRKKTAVLAKTGSLKCEVCGFDFFEFYGDIGYGFAECHHKKPIAELATPKQAKCSDLAIVCANCHRILHRIKPLPTIEELKETLGTRKFVQNSEIVIQD